MQVTMFLTDGLRPETVRVWQQDCGNGGGTLEGVEVTDAKGQTVCLHLASVADIIAFGERIIRDAKAIAELATEEPDTSVFGPLAAVAR